MAQLAIRALRITAVLSLVVLAGLEAWLSGPRGAGGPAAPPVPAATLTPIAPPAPAQPAEPAARDGVGVVADEFPPVTAAESPVAFEFPALDGVPLAESPVVAAPVTGADPALT